MNLIDTIAPSLRFLLKLQGRPATYVLNDAQTIGQLVAYVRGLRADDLFAAAMQQDIVGVIDAAAFASAFPARTTPARYDRLRTGRGSYAVEAWRGAPNDEAPVYFKLLLRGGQQ